MIPKTIIDVEKIHHTPPIDPDRLDHAQRTMYHNVTILLVVALSDPSLVLSATAFQGWPCTIPMDSMGPTTKMAEAVPIVREILR